MLGIVINTILLCSIMFIVARHEADYSFAKVAIISAGLGTVNLFLSLTLGSWPAFIIMLALTVWALYQFCYLRVKMAMLVTGIHFLCQIAIVLLYYGLTDGS